MSTFDDRLDRLDSLAAQAAYPERAVKMLVPWAAGGDTDNIFRPFAPLMQKNLGQPVVIANVGGASGTKGAKEATIQSLVTIVLPDMPAMFTPMVYAVPVQLLAYHTAVVMGTDVDQPRNLAKSVTVE